MSNSKRQSASAIAKPKKLLLYPGDPLIKILKPDHYVIVDPSTFSPEEGEYDPEIDPVDPVEPVEPGDGLEAPDLEDITLVSKKLVTDKNKNQWIEFVFNVKNHVGDSVVGAQVYGH